MGNTITDGSAVTSADLTSTANVKTYMGISGTDDDTLIGQLVSRASNAIENFCNRIFASTAYTEYHDGDGCARIILDHRPIISVTTIHDDLDRTFAASSLIAASDYITRDDEGIVEWLSGNATFPSTAAYFYDGQLNVKVVYTAGYATIPDAVEQACIMMVAAMYNRGKQGADGIDSDAHAGAYTVTYARSLLVAPTTQIRELLLPYREIVL